MRYAGPVAGRPGFSKKREKGQALIYGLFVLMSGLAALFFLFNTGQLSREKTKLVNTADAVAYSAGVMHARALNFEAYTNRAMVANTVAIAQLVSLSSWIQYASNLATFGGAVATNPKFVMFYPSYFASLYSGPYLDTALNESAVLENLAKASDNIIQKILMKAQSVAYDGLLLARPAVMDEVAKANYHDDGVVTIDPVLPTATEFTDFVKPYSGDDRTRFAEVAKTSANKDGFLPKRSWFMPALWADCATAFPRVDWMDRRGGTELVSFDEWKAIDTLSEKEWTPRDKFDPFCSAIAEVPMGWGSRTAADSSTIDPNPTHYDSSIIVNPGPTAAAIVTSSAWGYKGLPSFYDLSTDALAQDDPRLKFAIRVKRDKSQTVTSEGRSAIAPTPRLNAYAAKPAGGNELVAVSASEVFFEREGDAKDNEYGKSLGKPREIGSLFNPYWQVHLIQSDGDVHKAQAMQGAVLP
ncbi:hypothetical protein EGT07_00465 [Herbaspirillum sp. HC18]|nr:hypothetical protein EGT07_00465 [Herbaspirillum sp. HC18]